MPDAPVPELDSRPQGRREWSGWLTSLVLPIAFGVALIGGLVYLQANRGDGDDGGPYGTVALDEAHNPTGQAPRAEAGRAAPDFVLESTSGGVIHLSDMQGRPVIVTFFATWCNVCRTQMPLLTAADTGGSDGVLVLAVNVREAAGPVKEFAASYDAGFPVLLDQTGEVAATWRVGGRGQPLPATFFVDRTGVIRKVVEGALTASELSQGLRLIEGGGD